MAEYVPNLGQIADWVNRHQPIQWPERALDAAIAAHDAAVKAEALRGASHFVTDPDVTFHSLDDVRDWLRDRADRIEAES